MDSEQICRHCGKPIGPKTVGGLCPECLLKAGLGSGVQPADGPTGPAQPPPRPAAPAPEAIARHFPQLEILELLGQGGMGVVYKARQKQLERLVALKILPAAAGSDSTFAQRFATEARALARLNHPNIVAVHDFGQAGGFYYFIMEFVDGANLRQLERTRRLAPEEALAIVPKICEALQYAHDQGIVHRDIKPENILLDNAGHVKIADFGIAKILGQPASGTALTGAKDVVGTPHYMAPEQVEKPQTVDHRADIYSLGVVFYELLTGELPLGKFSPPSARMEGIRVDVRLDEVVLHALEKEPARRYQHASQVKSDVETIAATAPGAPVRRPDETPWVARVRWTARVLGTILLAFIGLFVLAEGLPPLGSQPEGVQLTFAALGLMLAGFIVGWKRDGAAALLIASGLTLHQISEGRIAWNLFQTPLPVAALYAYCWWAAQGRRTVLLGKVIVGLAVVLAAGFLLLPTSVFVLGVVTDAVTAKPIAHAAVTLQPARRTPGGLAEIPNARSDPMGRFSLYVGWYGEQKQVVINAPGYQPLRTDLGPRPFGSRRVARNFALPPLISTAAAHNAAEDVADVPAAEHLAGGDPRKIYLLIGRTNHATAPKAGWALLLVLPGGDGGRDFQTFVKRIWKNALPQGFVAAQLIAPQWDPRQADQIVWPTEKSPYPAMKFSTETFAEAVITDIQQSCPLDPRRIFTLSWSSGGPAGYAISLYPATRVRGSLIAMSVFKPERLPDLKAARDKAYYLLHSPEDFIPMRMAEQAREGLMAAGAKVRLQTYPGGHGWQGDVFPMIQSGVQWLEQQTAGKTDAVSPAAQPN